MLVKQILWRRLEDFSRYGRHNSHQVVGNNLVGLVELNLAVTRKANLMMLVIVIIYPAEH
jgi:hypothetical protein